MGHADGICHIYVGEDADVARSVRVVMDAKVQYTAACNAVETLLVHRGIARDFLPELAKAFEAEGVTIRGTDEVRAIIACEPATDADWSTEYLAPVISIRLVDSVDEAISHINRYGSHHTDAIMTENDAVAEHFMPLIEPLEYREQRLVRDFVIVIDTSGSVDGEVVQKFVDTTLDVLTSEGAFCDRVNVHGHPS